MKLNIIVILTLFALIGCNNGSEKSSAEKEAKSSTHHEWDYSGESGPDAWAELESGSDCGGLHQSPINIIDIQTKPGTIVERISEIQYEEKTTIKSITNNGHTIQYNFNGDLNVIGYKEKEYKMKQFHFHSPSEHTLNGVRYPLEIHMVHHSEESNSYIVFAVMVQQGQPDSTFTFLKRHLPVNEGETKEVNESYDFGSTISETFEVDSINVYAYQGSLTTPPCTESVLWVVMKDVGSASAIQIELLQKLMPNNNYRETQPLNDRTIYLETISDND